MPCSGNLYLSCAAAISFKAALLRFCDVLLVQLNHRGRALYGGLKCAIAIRAPRGMTNGRHATGADSRHCIVMQKNSPPSTRVDGQKARARQSGDQVLRSRHLRADKFRKFVVI
jgi:hypothetical protein